MEIYFFILILFTFFIAYKINYLVVAYSQQLKKESEKRNYFSTLYPAFSEREINRTRDVAEEWDELSEIYEMRYQDLRKKETEAHIKAFEGMVLSINQALLNPSEDLRKLLLQMIISFVARNTLLEDNQKMIEANIFVLNGKKTISEVVEEFWEKKNRVPYENTDIIKDPEIYLKDDPYFAKIYKERFAGLRRYTLRTLKDFIK